MAKLFRATCNITLPETLTPNKFEEGEVYLFSLGALTHPGVRIAQQNGWLLATDKITNIKLPVVYRTPDPPDPPTAEEIVDALQEHPELLEEVKQLLETRALAWVTFGRAVDNKLGGGA